MLKQMQDMPLDMKISMTKSRIREWINTFGEDGVYISFSGGKDSTVLLHLVREDYPDVEAVFINTGLEYPEIQKFAQSFDNVTVIRPKMRFDEVIKTYGYPLISKEVSERLYNTKKCIEMNGEHYIEHYYQITGTYPNLRARQLYDEKLQSRFTFFRYRPLLDVDFDISNKCCNVMKKASIKRYVKDRCGITAQMADESRLRTQKWLQNGCNGFEMKHPLSNPMSFWTEQDVLTYIHTYNIPICSVYGSIVETQGKMSDQLTFEGHGKLKCTGCQRTGCIFCGFGAHCKDDRRFIMLKQTHPKQYEYCMGGGAYDTDGKWKPNKQGLGMAHVFDVCNSIYGKDFIRYE